MAKQPAATLTAPSRNIKGIIERSASKEPGAWEAAKDDWYKAYLAGEVSAGDLDSLFSRLPGKKLCIGTFAPSAEAMLAEVTRLNSGGIANIYSEYGEIEIAFHWLQKMKSGKYYLKPGKGEDEFYWVRKEGDLYNIYPPDAKTDYELVLRTIYMLGAPISCKLHKSEINASVREIADRFMEVLEYISITGGGKSFILSQYATAHEKNAHLKHKCLRQITSFFVEPQFEKLISKSALAYAERVEYD